MVEAHVERTDWWVIPDSEPSAGDASAARESGYLRLLPTPDDASRSAARDVDADDPFERAGLRVGRVIGRLGRHLAAPAASGPAPVAATRADNVVALRDTAAAAPSAPTGVDWSQVKHLLDVVDVLPPLRAVAETLLGPWGLDLLVVAGAAVGLLYPGNPFGIITGHAELLELAVPLLKVALGAVLSPLAVEVALALLGLGRLLWSRRATAPRPALGV